MRQKFQRSLGIEWNPRKRVRQEGQASNAKQKAGTLSDFTDLSAG